MYLIYESCIDSESRTVADETTCMIEWLLLCCAQDPPVTPEHHCVLLSDVTISLESLGDTLFNRLTLLSPFNLIKNTTKDAAPPSLFAKWRRRVMSDDELSK